MSAWNDSDQLLYRWEVEYYTKPVLQQRASPPLGEPTRGRSRADHVVLRRTGYSSLARREQDRQQGNLD
eukprot:scaffold1518_cov417-Prasinococcus_capsulatus_cf.AAC.42